MLFRSLYTKNLILIQCGYYKSNLSWAVIFRITRHGLPDAITPAGISLVTFKSKTGRKLPRNARTRRKRLPVRILPEKRMGFRLSLHRLALARGMRNDLRGKKFRNLFYRYGKSGIKARLRNVYQQRRFAPLFSGAKQFYAEYRFFAPTARRKKRKNLRKIH